MYNFETIEEGTKYQILITEKARGEIKSLDNQIAERVYQKLVWLGNSADLIIHYQLTSLPDDLKGHWVYHGRKEIKIYEVEHRSKVYKKF